MSLAPAVNFTGRRQEPIDCTNGSALLVPAENIVPAENKRLVVENTPKSLDLVESGFVASHVGMLAEWLHCEILFQERKPKYCYY